MLSHNFFYTAELQSENADLKARLEKLERVVSGYAMK